nr:GNAT family N-acetyltransferase [Mycolicibacterium baixiangningiae]
MRVQTRPHRLADWTDALLDKSTHAARCRDMAPCDGRVTLQRLDTPEVALGVVAERYAQLAATDPALSNNMSLAAPDDLRYWHAHQQLWAITRGADTIGAFAVVPGALGWITGQEINEQARRQAGPGLVISAPHTGQRYATSTQCAWAHRWAADTTDLLIGTIDRHNYASRATALRAGRPRVLDNVFISLD